MSKYETPMTLAYWERVGGTLVTEYLVVPRRQPDRGPRSLDGVILPNREKRHAHWREVPLEGEDVIVVQAKVVPARLGMYLLGQALFSRHLVERFNPASVRTVALCLKDDAVLRPLAEQYGIEVEVMPEFASRRATRR